MRLFVTFLQKTCSQWIRLMMHEFEPRYTPPDRKTISTDSTCYLPDLHDREKQCLQKLLKGIDNYSITTDLWTRLCWTPCSLHQQGI